MQSIGNYTLIATAASAAVAVAIAQSSSSAAPAPPAPPPSAQLPAALPAVPGFEAIAPEGGVHSVASLRAAGRLAPGAELRVKGYITWVYDCALDLAAPGAAGAQVRPRGAGDPALCGRQELHLAASRDAPAAQAIRVVGVPLRLPFAVGDHVAITGAWEHAAAGPGAGIAAGPAAAGALAFRAIEASRPGGPPTRGAPPPAPVLPAQVPQLNPPLRKVDEATRKRSLADAAECERLRLARKLDEAIAACWRATNAWNGNEAGLLSLGRAQMDKGDHRAAIVAFLMARRVEPGRAITHLLFGKMSYLLNVEGLRSSEAHPDREPDDVARRARWFDEALRSLLRAIELDASLWEAHYLVGLIHVHRGEPRAAALALTAAASRAPTAPEPLAAFAALYRRWGYAREAAATARFGAAHATGSDAIAALWYEAALAHAELRDDPAALDAASQALAHQAAHPGALLLRARLSLRRGDRAAARRDAEALAAAEPPAGHVRQEAHRLLRDLAAVR